MRRIVPLSPARWGRLFGRLNFRRVEECRVILRWLDARSGERILDVGCGDGYYDWRIARSGAHVTGIDLHERRLEFARRHYGGDRVEFLPLDAVRADFPAGSFDKALSLCVMEHLGDDERVLANVSRAMKPGGRLTFSADSLSNDGITPEERERHRRRYAVNRFYTIDIVSDKLSRAGFEIEEARYVLSSPYALMLVRLSWKLDRLPPVLVPLRVLGYAVLGAAWKVSTAFGGRRAAGRPAAKGLTLLVRARKEGCLNGRAVARLASPDESLKCVIIAAGRGSRLAEIAPSKPLLKVAGEPLIGRAIEAARGAGVREFVVVTGYAGDEVEKYLEAKAAADGISIATVRNEEWDKENGLSVLKAEGLSGERFFLMMADHIVDARILDELKRQPIGHDEVILAVDARITGHPFVDLDDVTRVRHEGGRIAAIGKTIPAYNAFDTGVFLCTPALFAALEASQRRGDYSLSGGIRVLAEEGKARTWDIGDRFWIDVDDERALGKAESVIVAEEDKSTRARQRLTRV